MSEKTKAKRKKAGQSTFSTFTAKPKKLGSNPERQAKRRKVYAKALRSPHWKQLRAQVYAEQDGLCICGQEPMTILDHKTYARLGHELREDVQGLGDVCNARETTSKRANWFQPQRG